jgi:serine/threonine protein kinase
MIHPLGEAAMTTLLPAEDRFSPTLIRTTIPARYQYHTRRRAAVNDAPVLAGYRMLGVIGRGGMAYVYKARQLRPKRLVAVKVIDHSLTDHGQLVARFRQEQALGARLRHPNLIAVYQAGCAEGCPYLVMEYVEGDNLDRLVGRVGPLSVAEACEVIRQAARGLQHLHEHGLVHRDVKPSNLMLTPAGQVKVLDLGLARDLHERDEWDRLTWQGQFLGTLDYVAPEQCADPHAVDIRADVYGLGCTLYELLTGQPPFARPGYESVYKKMKAHVEAPVPPIQERRPDVPEELAFILERMLAKDREVRFASPADVAQAMEPFAAGAELAALAGASLSAVPAA